MADEELSLAMRLALEARGFTSGLEGSSRDLKRWGREGREEVGRLGEMLERTKKQLEAFGIGLGGFELLKDAAHTERQLTQIGFRVGATRDQVRELREELEREAGATGTSFEELLGTAGDIASHGDKMEAIAGMVTSADKATKVLGGSVRDVTLALRDMALGFNLDLSKPEAATALLDKMAVSTTRGNAGLDVVAQVVQGMGKKGGAPAGMGPDETLAWIQALSTVDASPAAISTMSRSLAMLFNSPQAKAEVWRATGVPFAAHGRDRDPVAVLRDLERGYLGRRTQVDREVFLARAFAKGDPTLMPVLRQLFERGSLDKMDDTMKAMRQEVDWISERLPESMHDGAAQAARLKEQFKQTADLVAGPIQAGLASVMEWNAKVTGSDKGGMHTAANLGLTAAELGGLSLAGYGLKVLGTKAGGWVGRLLGGATDTAKGVAEGKALEQLAGVTPVFVTNWPGGALGGLPGEPPLSKLPKEVEGAAGGGVLRAGALRMLGAFGIAAGGGFLADLGVAGAIKWFDDWVSHDKNHPGKRWMPNSRGRGGGGAGGSWVDDPSYHPGEHWVATGRGRGGGGGRWEKDEPAKATVKLEISADGSFKVKQLNSDSAWLGVDVSTGPVGAGVAQ